jgi:hypothetical protein
VPRKKRVRTAKQELVRQQKALAAAIGLTRDVKEYAEGRAAIESAKQGDLSPVRQRQLAEGFAKAGLAHLQ